MSETKLAPSSCEGDNSTELIRELTVRLPDFTSWKVRQYFNWLHLCQWTAQQRRSLYYLKARDFHQHRALDELRHRPLVQREASQKLKLRAVTGRQCVAVRKSFGQMFYRDRGRDRRRADFERKLREIEGATSL